MGFAKYVWSPQAALDIVRDDLGLSIAEAVADNDFGPALYLLDRAAFVRHHAAVGDHARERGVAIPSVFTFYRDAGAVAHPDPHIREAASAAMSGLIHQAAAVGASYGCAAIMTANRDDFVREPEASLHRALTAWTRWMTLARTCGLRGLLVEMSAQPREACATIEGTRAILDWLGAYHAANPDDTVPVELCYDVGHGISPSEAPDDRERDYRAWFEAFPDAVREVHIKNTDRTFEATWPFTNDYVHRGIINPRDVISAIRDSVRGPVLVILEIAGKRGREVGELAILRDLKETVNVWTDALRSTGYRNGGDGSWERESG